MPEDVPPQPAAKPKLSAQERRRRWEDRLAALRLRMAIGRELEERGIADPAAIGAALGLPAPEAAKLLTRHQWRESNVALLRAVTRRRTIAAAPADPPPSSPAGGRCGEGGPWRPRAGRSAWPRPVALGGAAPRVAGSAISGKVGARLTLSP